MHQTRRIARMKGRIMSRFHKPKLHHPLPSHPPAAPIAISIDGVAAGLALRDSHRFRFFSGHPYFDLLDGSRFSRIEDVRWAVKRLSQANSEAGETSPPAAGAHGELAL
jgi:hypothetical protein